MGDYLSKPDTNHHNSVYEDQHISIKLCYTRGWWRFQEDGHLLYHDQSLYICAIFDGHGGVEVSEYL